MHMSILFQKRIDEEKLFSCLVQPFADDVSLLIPRPVEIVPGAIADNANCFSAHPPSSAESTQI